MKEINNFLKRVLVFFLFFTVQAESKILSIGSPDAKVAIKVFSSLTCPHCANFHEVVFDKVGLKCIIKIIIKPRCSYKGLDLFQVQFQKL